MGANHRIQHIPLRWPEAYLPKYNFVMEHFYTLWLTVDPLAYDLKGPLGWLPSLRSKGLLLGFPYRIPPLLTSFGTKLIPRNFDIYKHSHIIALNFKQH